MLFFLEPTCNGLFSLACARRRSDIELGGPSSCMTSTKRVRVCIHTHMRAHVHKARFTTSVQRACVYAYACVRMRMCLCERAHMPVYVCAYACVRMHMRVCVCAYACVRMRNVPVFADVCIFEKSPNLCHHGRQPQSVSAHHMLSRKARRKRVFRIEACRAATAGSSAVAAAPGSSAIVM